MSIFLMGKLRQKQYKTRAFRVALIGFLALVGLLIPVSVRACTCGMQYGSVPIRERAQKERESSDAVFVGRVIENITPANAVYVALFKVQVETGWKGVKAEEVTVSTGLDGMICGFRFEVGATYLIYADGSAEKGFGTSKCTRTAPVGALPDDREYLGEPNYLKPRPDVSEPELTGSSFSQNLLAHVSLMLGSTKA